jgi:hypothetical protein
VKLLTKTEKWIGVMIVEQIFAVDAKKVKFIAIKDVFIVNKKD